LPAHERSGGSGSSHETVPAINALSDAEFQEFFLQAPNGFVVLDRQGNICFANQEFQRLIGRDALEMKGLTIQSLLPHGGRIFYENQLVPILLLRGSAREISLELLVHEGRRLPVFINAVLHRRQNDNAEFLLLSVFEAHQRRRYEKELLRARQEFEQIADVVRRSSDAILRVGASGEIQSWNAGAAQIFGLSEREAVGKQLSDLFDPTAIPDLGTAFVELGRGLDVGLEAVGLPKDRRRVELSVNMTPHLEAPGILVAFSAVIRDITSRKQAERALIQNEKLASVGRLASSIAHEINNPLEAVTNLLYILESRVEGDEAKALVNTAQAELARVSHIATHTLRFHKQSSAKSAVDVGALVDSVLSLYHARLENSGVKVSNDCSAASPLFCFEGELRQVMVNLVSNAFDAMRNGGRLTIRSRDITHSRSGVRGLRVTVADTGSGMDARTVERLFEPFFSTKGIGGTGLGLWISKDLVDKNRGKIRIRSQNKPDRHGTVVIMLFPHQLPQCT
jgi:PAS domain S-box-containing protein